MKTANDYSPRPAADSLTRDAMNAFDTIGIIVVIVLISWLLLRE